MARRKNPPPPVAFDFDQFARDLRSPDAETRARAARGICPCRLGWEVFERCMALVEPLRKDPSPMVRGAALHVFEDAFEMQSRGLPTTPRAIRNEMVARRREHRWADDEPERRGEERHPGPRAGKRDWGARARYRRQPQEEGSR